MMIDFIFGIALVLFGLPQQQIFHDGFEEPDVYIGVDGLTTENTYSFAISSSHSNTAVALTSFSYLLDGKVAIPFRFTWAVGTPVVTDNVAIIAGVTGFTIPNGGLVAFAVLCPNTPYALPVGAKVNYLIEDASDLIGGTAYVTQFNNGGTGIIGVIRNTLNRDLIPEDFHINLVNINSGGSTWATSGQTFDIGEFWIGNLQEFKALTDPKYDLVDPTLMRRSHSNQPWPLFVKPYRQWTYDFAPMDTTDAFDSSSFASFDTVRYQISQANKALFLTRIYVQGTTTIDPIALYQQACFGKPESVGALSGVKEGMGIWNASAKIGEAPP
jgi:hypothetical protein